MQKWLQIFVTLQHSFQTFSRHRHWWPPRFLRTLQRMHFETLERLFLQRYWRFLLLRQHWPPPHELCRQQRQSHRCYFYTTQRFRCAR
ncbi:hypothetical protein F7F67_17415 [Escherichia coli]|nr:hypothetical protein F7F75_22940 [Escherichia coli]KAA9883878.1 hypothetical protein F7F67_17415 [Escherichia coli]